MSERTESATVQIKLRIKEPLRARLEHAAAQRGASMNSEMARRLERSFEREEQAGGAHMTALTQLWQAAFRHGAVLGAKARDLDSGDMDEALRDQFVYRTAVHAATERLLSFRPVTFEGADYSEQDREGFMKMLDVMARATARGEWLEEKK